MYNPNEKLKEIIKQKGGFINAHAHFDRSFTVTEENMKEVVNYHLFDKWEFVDRFKRSAEVSDYLKNFERAIITQMHHGVVGALTFVDVDSICNYKALEAAQLAKKTAIKRGFTLKICSQALKGVIKPKENRLLRDALERNQLDAIGGLPRADDPYQQAHLDEILYLGKTYNKLVHVHVDQLNHDLEKETELLARRTMRSGMEGKVTAVHGISIACHNREYRKDVYKMCADAGISFVSCPTAWIDSRRRETLSPTHNAITPVEEMLEYGLTVAIGSDNIHDVYKPYSTGDMSTELRFLLEALHMYDPQTLSEIATTNGRLVIGMEEYNDGHKRSEKGRSGLL